MWNLERLTVGRAVAACALSIAAVAVQAEPIRLMPATAIKMATAQNPSSAASDVAVAIKRAQLGAVSGWMPQIDASAKTLYGEGEPTSFFATQNVEDPDEPDNRIAGGGQISGSVDLSLPIYQQGVFFNRQSPAVREADRRYAKARHEGEFQQVDLAHSVMKLYIGALQAGAEIALLQDIYDRRLQQLDVTKQRVASGISPVSDEHAVEKALASSLRDLNIANRREDLQHIQLRLLLGLDLGQEIELFALQPQVPPLPSLGDLVQQMLQDHPRVAIQQSDVEIAKAELSGARAAGAPTLSLVSRLTATDNIEGDDVRTFVSVGLNLAMPFTDFMQRNSSSSPKAYALQESQYRRAELQDTLIAELYAAYYSVLDGQDTLVSSEKVLEQTMSDEQLVRTRYEEGQETIDTVVSSENETLGARLNVLGARYNVWFSYAVLFRATGQPFSEQGLVVGQ